MHLSVVIPREGIPWGTPMHLHNDVYKYPLPISNWMALVSSSISSRAAALRILQVSFLSDLATKVRQQCNPPIKLSNPAHVPGLTPPSPPEMANDECLNNYWRAA